MEVSLFKGFTLGCLEAALVDLDQQFVFAFLMVDVGIGVELHGAGELSGEGKGVVGPV